MGRRRKSGGSGSSGGRSRTNSEVENCFSDRGNNGADDVCIDAVDVAEDIGAGCVGYKTDGSFTANGMLAEETEKQQNSMSDKKDSRSQKNSTPVGRICCSPLECNFEDSGLSAADEEEAVRVLCNNENCTESGWMHGPCFDVWQESILNYLRTCGRARSWSEKQRQQNVWTRRGYDLVYRVCDCLCGKGHLRKDLESGPRPPAHLVQQVQAQVSHVVVSGNTTNTGRSRRRSGRRRSEKNLPGVVMNQRQGGGPNSQSTSTPAVDCTTSGTAGNSNVRTRRRSRHLSNSSAFSSSPGTTGSAATSPDGAELIAGMENFNLGPRGNIFEQRVDFSMFGSLPPPMRNLYRIMTEDESSSGNDEAKQLVLTTLTYFGAKRLPCLLCSNLLTVYDHLPLVDGTFFLSPVLHSDNAGFAIRPQNTGSSSGTNGSSFLHAVCMHCLAGGNGSSARCRSCNRAWSGTHLLIGGLYCFDVLAAMPCCPERLRCSKCGAQAMSQDQRVGASFAQFSQRAACVQCKQEDYHFAKKFHEVFKVQANPPLKQKANQQPSSPIQMQHFGAPGSPVPSPTQPPPPTSPQQQQQQQQAATAFC